MEAVSTSNLVSSKTEKTATDCKTVRLENCLKRGDWIVCRFKRGLGKTERLGVGGGGGGGGVGVKTPMHTVSWRSLLIDTSI